MSDASLANEVIRDAMLVFAENVQPGKSVPFGGVFALVTGVPHPNFTSTWMVHDDVDPDDLRAGLVYLADTGFVYSACIRSSVDEHLTGVLADRGFVKIYPTPTLLTRSPSGLPWPNELERVSGTLTLDDHRYLLEKAFDMSSEMVDGWVTEPLLADDRLTVVVGRKNGVPVTTAAGVRVGDALAVFNVATLPAHRGKGFGAAATAAIVDAGFDDGVGTVVLQSSDIGLSVYQSLGFEIVMHHERWGFPDQYRSHGDI
ncbi:MAG: GNAT family N-acetyltransferase [Acidimicrobiia bacterium]